MANILELFAKLQREAEGNPVPEPAEAARLPDASPAFSPAAVLPTSVYTPQKAEIYRIIELFQKVRLAPASIDDLCLQIVIQFLECKLADHHHFELSELRALRLSLEGLEYTLDEPASTDGEAEAGRPVAKNADGRGGLAMPPSAVVDGPLDDELGAILAALIKTRAHKGSSGNICAQIILQFFLSKLLEGHNFDDSELKALRLTLNSFDHVFEGYGEWRHRPPSTKEDRYGYTRISPECGPGERSGLKSWFKGKQP